MAEYIEKEKLVDGLDKTLKNIPSFPSDPIGRELVSLGIETVIKTVKALPAADVRPVVLCRDCYAYRRDKELVEAAYLDLERYCGLLRCEMDEDSFCSYGKRKEET